MRLRDQMVVCVRPYGVSHRCLRSSPAGDSLLWKVSKRCSTPARIRPTMTHGRRAPRSATEYREMSCASAVQRAQQRCARLVPDSHRSPRMAVHAAPPAPAKARDTSHAEDAPFDREIEERFLRYVRIDTQSDETSTTSPSTERQFDLLRPL